MRPSDYPNLLLWALDETHITVTAATGLTLLATQNAQVAWFSLGALTSTLIARAVKHTIKQPRPPAPAPEFGDAPVRPKRTYGMPSTHSTALAFYFFYLWPKLPLLTGHKAFERAILFVITALTLWSRVELGYHTPQQVLGGVVVGWACAFVWQQLWDNTSAPTIVQDIINWVRNLISLR